MKTLKSTKTWILICSILGVSSTSEHASSHQDVIQHGDSAPWKKRQNTIVPYGIQMPDHVLSKQDLSCISADNNIFEIMNKAQESCNGTDMRCTFYHFINHGYENLGTLDINKERFDDLLMKFDNWLLTAEDIEKRGDGKTKEDSSVETGSIGVDGGISHENSSNSTEMKGVDASQEHIDKLNLSINKSVDDRVHSHHLRTPHEIHHKIDHGKDHNSVIAANIHGKNESYIKLNPEYNTERRYFEVYIPRDKVTGKPRTIYVEVDQDKNEFVFVDEEIDKKLKGIKPIRIELDELSGIADTAFNEVTKTSDFKEHVHNHLSDDEKAIISDISKHSEVNVDAVHLDNINIGEQMQNSMNPSVSHLNIYNIEAEEQHKPDDMTENISEIINVNNNHIVPNKYINEAQFNIESHTDNSTDDKQNYNFELLESNNTETDTHTDFDETEEPFATIEYNDNNTYALNDTENSSLDYSDISYENDNDTCTDYYELSTEHNVTSDDDSYVQLEEHNDTCHVDYDDTHDFSSSNKLNLNEFTVQIENPVQGHKLKSTPFNNAEPKLTSSITTGISDYTDSQLHAENRRGGYTDLHDLSLEPTTPLGPYTSVPILGKKSAKILNSNSYLKSSPPAYATLDLHAEDSQNTPSNFVIEHPSISSYISPLDSVCTPSAAPKISQYSPSVISSPPMECIVRPINKDSKNSPLNLGVNWLPSHSRIEEVPLSLDHVFSPQDSISRLTVPIMEYIGSSQSSPDRNTHVKDITFIQNIPSSSYGIQEPSLITTPYELESTTPMPPKHVLLSKLGLPKSNTDYETIPAPNPSSVKPCSLIDAVSSPCPIQKNLPCLQKNILSPIDSPYSANSNRYPYTTIPYFSNPYLKSPQFKPSYSEPLLQNPLQPASKISTLDSVPISLEQNYPCLTGVCPQDEKTIQFLPFALKSQFSPLTTLPYPNIWNNIPYLPYTDQNIRNNSPCLSNYLTPTTDQNHKPLLTKTVEHPCSPNNILEIKPSYTPFLPVHTLQVQKDLNPSLALERDLESLSLKYGIPLSKILHSIETEISDSKTYSPIPNCNLKYDGSITAQQSYPLSEANAYVNDEIRSCDEELLESDLTNLSPLDSSLIGPHLELENSLDTCNSQSYTILSETTGPVPTPHLSVKTQKTIALKDNSLIGPQLSTLSSSNILLSDENPNANEFESDSSSFMSLDATLAGPHLNIGSPTVVLDSQISQGGDFTSQSELLSTSSSQIESKLNQNQPTNLLLDSSLTGSHLQSLSPFKPLFSNEIESINKMVPLESDLTDLTPLDISQVDLTNELVHLSIPAKPLLTNEIQTINEMIPLESDLTDLTPLDMSQADFVIEESEILQHEKSTVILSANPKLHKTVEYLPKGLEGRELLLKTDSSRFIPLDSSLIGPVLNLESSPVITDTMEDNLTTTVSQDNLQKTDNKHDELESIILPASLLPTLLNKPGKADSNLNIISQETKLKEDLSEISVDANVTPSKETYFKIIVEPVKSDLNLNVNTQNTQLNEKISLDNYVEIPLADNSQIYLKETDFKIIEETPELHDSNIIPLLSKNSNTLKDKLTSPVMSLVNHEPQLESSLIGTSMLPKIQRPVTSSTDSSVQLNNYLVGPSILNEIDFQSPVLETVNQLESSIAAASIEHNIKPSETATIDYNIQFDSSLIGPSLHSDISSHGTSTVYDSVTQFDTSSVAPSLYEAGIKKSSVLDAKSHLDTSLIIPSLYETVKASASSSTSSQLDSSLLGISLKPEMETHEESPVLGSKKLDSTLVGQHLSTLPFSSDKVQMINNELHQKSELANLIPLDSTLIGPHLNFESQSDQSEISWYQNPEFSTSDIAPGILETIDLLNSDFVKRHPPKLNTVSLINQSDLQELLSNYKNSITKSQISPSEFKPCGKLLSSIAKQSTDNIKMSPTYSNLHSLTWNTLLNTPLSLLDDTASEFSPITLAYPEKGLRPIVKRPCLDSNYYSTQQTFAELLPYAQGVQQIPITPYSPFLQMRPLVDRNWIPQPLDIQNILKAGIRPAVGNAPIMPLAAENLKLLLDLASQSKTFPQLSMPNISPPMIAIPPSLDRITLSNNLPVEKYIPSLPKKKYSILPSNLEPSIRNPEYTIIEVDDIMTLLDENSYKLLQDLSILPPSQSPITPSTPVFETGEIVSPSLSDTSPILDSDYIKSSRPVLPVSIPNAMVPTSIYTNPQIGSYNPQNIPYMIPKPNIAPYNLQPYLNAPLEAQYSEIVDYVPKIESLPVESSKSSLAPQWHEIPKTPQLMEPIPNFTLDSEFLQQLLSKPSLESPINLPSSLFDSMLQLSTAPNKSKSYPCQSLPEFFTPVSPVLTTPSSNAYSSPVLPIYASPLSVSYAKPISSKSTSLPLNLPYAPSSLTPLPISPYTHTSSSVVSGFSSPLRTFKTMPFSNYPSAPTEIYNRSIPSRIPYKPSQMYSSPYLPVYPSPLPVENSLYSTPFRSNLTPSETSLISPVFYEPLTAPYFSPEMKSKPILNFGTSTYSGSSTPVSPIPSSTTITSSSTTGILPPSFNSPDLSTYKYSPISAPDNTLTQPSSNLSPAYTTSISPASSILPSYNQPLPSKPMFNLKPEITTQELENLRLLNTLPVFNTNNPFSNANQMLLTNSNILPLQHYYEHVPKWTPLSNSRIKQIKPSEDKIESNILTTSLTDETPYEITEENMYLYNNNEDNKYYEDYNFKYPLECLSCTLAAEDIVESERRPKEDFIKLDNHQSNHAFEPLLQSKLYRRPVLTPYTEPLIRPCPTPQLLPHPSLIEPLPQSISDNIPLEPSLRPLNHPVSLPASILSSLLLKPLTPLTPAVNLPLLPRPCIDTYLRLYKVLPTDEMLSFSSPYHSATSQDMLAPPPDPRRLRKILSPQLTSASSQVSAPFVPISSPTSSPTSACNLDNYIELPITYNQPQSKKQDTIVTPSAVPSYNQYSVPFMSHVSLLETPISSQYICPLTTAESLEKPIISPQYISSILPMQTKLQEICPLNETPLNYQPYIQLPTVTSPYTVVPSIKTVEPINSNLIIPQWLSFTPQYSLPASFPPISKLSPVNSLSNVKYSTITPDVGKLPMSNHITPSSLFMPSDTDFQTIPLKKSAPLQSLLRYTYPLPNLKEPLEIVPYETPKKPLGKSILPQNIFKPNPQYHNGKYTTAPLSSSPYLTQPLEIIDSFQTQPLPSNKPHPKLPPILAQYPSPSLAPSFTSLPFETVPNSGINKHRVPQYSLANAPTPIQSSALGRNPFLNKDFKFIAEVPSYPVPNNQISPLKLTPSESILLSNLRPLDISKKALESSPITSSTPLSLLNDYPGMIPINSHYVSYSQIDSAPQILPCISSILKSPLLKPLLTNIQNNSPSLQNYVSNSNIAFSESSPMKSIPFVSSNQKYAAPSESLVSELPETPEPINPVTPYSVLKPPFYKQYQSPVTMKNIPTCSNYDVLESSPYLPIKGNYMNTVKAIEVSPISAAESSRLPLESLDTEVIEELIPYELRPDLKDKFSQLPLNLYQQRQFYPTSSYLALPLPTHITSASSNYITAKPIPFSIHSVLPEDVELIDTTDFIPISPIQSEALTSSYSQTVKKAPISTTPSNIPVSNTLLTSPNTILSNTNFSPSTFKQLPLKSITNTQSIKELDMSQFSPYSILSNSDFSPLSTKHLRPTIQKQFTNQRPQTTKGLSSSQASLSSSSSPVALPSTNIDPQLITNWLTARPIPLTPLYASPITKTPENLLQLPLFGKYSPLQETPIEITPEKENIKSLLNNYRPLNKIIPLGVNNYPYEPKSSIVQLLSELDSVKSVNPLIKSKEPQVEYIEDTKSNEEKGYVTAENVSLDEYKPDVLEAESFTKSLEEIIKGVDVPNYYNYNNVQRPQRLSNLDHFYANNHIGKAPQVFTAPTFNTSPIASSTDGERSYTTTYPEIYKDFSVIPIEHLGSAPKLDSSSRLTKYYPEIADSVETVPFTNSYTQNYINPSLKSYSQMKPTNAVEVTETSEIPSSSYNPFNDIKYSGYKTYQVPSLKSPKTTQNLRTSSQMYTPPLVPYSPLNSGKLSDVYQNPSPQELYEPTEIYEPLTPQYQAPQKCLSPLQTKRVLDTLQEGPELNDYGTIENESICIDDIKEDNELKTSLINYINKSNDINNKFDNNNQELTIPIGNIAITKKEAFNADTIETNNPSIALKVWKSNVKIAQAELKLKFKDLSVTNFMPLVNKLDQNDMEEIRKIVKNYIDEKYGTHVEINEPYTVDNQYTVIKDFEPNAVSNKYNLLWPTNYV